MTSKHGEFRFTEPLIYQTVTFGRSRSRLAVIHVTGFSASGCAVTYGRHRPG